MKFDYNKLQTGDVINCVGRGPFAAITRLVTKGKIVHTGIVIGLYGQKLVAEMGPRGLVLRSLERYNKSRRRGIHSIYRFEHLSDTVKIEIKKKVLKDLRKTIDYDFKGLFEFVFPKVKDNKKAFYCSEYVFALLREYIGSYPLTFIKKVSPNDLFRYVIKNHHWKAIDFEKKQKDN